MAYIICDPRKFDSVKDAEREVERVRIAMGRKKQKTGNNAKIMAGISDIDYHNSEGCYRYNDSKRNGGKKVFVGMFKCVVPIHIHWLVIGDGSSAMAEYIKSNLHQKHPHQQFRKEHLKTLTDFYQFQDYFNGQVMYVRKF